MPGDLDYLELTALSFEAREKLQRIRPATLGQAGRIDGVRAGDLAVLTVVLSSGSREARRREVAMSRIDPGLRSNPTAAESCAGTTRSTWFRGRNPARG